jgi:pimeloyl-ACP methyl ester carboxylesterase
MLDVGAGDHGSMLAGALVEPAVKESASMSDRAEAERTTSIPIEGGRIEAFQMPGGAGVPLLVLGGVELGFRPLAGTESVLQRRWAGRARRRSVTVLGRPIPDDPADASLLMHPRVIADGVARTLTALHLTPPVGPVAIEAESGGGRISLWLTVDHQDLVARLVLSSVASETPPDSPMATRMARWIELAEAQDWGRLFTGFAAQMQPAGDPGDDGGDAFSAAARLQPRPGTPERFIGELKATLDPSSFVTSRLGEIRVPTLVLAGDRDQVVPPDRTRQVADAIPGARFEHDPESGHTFRQSLRGYDELVEAFLAEGDPH